MSELADARAFLVSRTGKLAVTYLAIIMAMTLFFSIVIYGISTAQLHRPIHIEQSGPIEVFPRQQVETLFTERADEARGNLFWSLVFLNIVCLVAGGALSVYLARRTLAPIEAAMEAQSQFVSDASHELRTPITALQTTNEVALRKKQLTLDEAKDLIGHNVAEAVKLHQLTDSLLGLVKQELADTTKTKVSLRKVVQEAMDSLVPAVGKKEIALRSQLPNLTVMANAPALKQVLVILLDNAVKYSPAKSEVTIAAKRTRHATQISVTDRGIGIKPDEQLRIFDRFYRVDESRSALNVEGTGLGLAIAKAICERQGMEMTIKSKPGKGSTFTLHIRSQIV